MSQNTKSGYNQSNDERIIMLSNKENSNTIVNREGVLNRTKILKHKLTAVERRKISDYYEGNAFKPKRKPLAVKNIIKDVDTPEKSSHTTLLCEDDDISPIPYEDCKVDTESTGIYKPKFSSKKRYHKQI